MPDKKIINIVKELRNKLRQYDDFVGLYLYGSQITETATPESDIDVIAVFDTDRSNQTDLYKIPLDIELEQGVFIDFHPMTLNELNLDWMFFNEVKQGLYYAR